MKIICNRFDNTTCIRYDSPTAVAAIGYFMNWRVLRNDVIRLVDSAAQKYITKTIIMIYLYDIIILCAIGEPWRSKTACHNPGHRGRLGGGERENAS